MCLATDTLKRSGIRYSEKGNLSTALQWTPMQRFLYPHITPLQWGGDPGGGQTGKRQKIQFPSSSFICNLVLTEM